MIAPALKGFADLDLGIAIDVRRIEEIDAQIEGAMNKRDGIRLALCTTGVHISKANAHCSKSNGGNFEVTSAELAFLHMTSRCDDHAFVSAAWLNKGTGLTSGANAFPGDIHDLYAN
jgi:hypothetical protein